MKSIIFPLFICLLIGVAQVYGIGFKCKSHIVLQSGDSCNKVSGTFKEYSVRLKDLKYYNAAMDCGNLYVGQKLCVEINFNQMPEEKKYVIQEGDTCKSIASKFGISKKTLKQYNPVLGDCSDSSVDAKVGLVISVQEDRDYTPNFKNSKRVYHEKK
eukprot:jgi/Orpsp1_1/1185340/evm.model.c7180000093335.1